MKNLYAELHSLVNVHQNSKDATLSLPDQLYDATNYIKKLQTKLERMKEKKGLLGFERSNSVVSNDVKKVSVKSPDIEVHENGSSVAVVLITDLGKGYTYFSQIIRILHEEGHEVLNAKFTIVGDTAFHTFHAEVGYPEDSESTGAAWRILEKFHKFIDKDAQGLY